jgi:hypothetical protein
MSPSEPLDGQVADRPEGPDSALPSVGARVTAFVAVLVGGAGGAIIGYAFATLQCGAHQSCTTSRSLLLWAGSLLGAGGVATVAVLTLRAIGEWRTIRDDPT